MSLEKCARRNAEQPAMNFRKAVERSGFEDIEHHRERDREYGQTRRAQPQIADAILEDRQRQTDAREKQNREHALAQCQEAVVSHDRAAAAAKVRRLRIRINRMRWPVRRMEA